jgi:hypothetical protein
MTISKIPAEEGAQVLSLSIGYAFKVSIGEVT